MLLEQYRKIRSVDSFIAGKTKQRGNFGNQSRRIRNDNAKRIAREVVESLASNVKLDVADVF